MLRSAILSLFLISAVSLYDFKVPSLTGGTTIDFSQFKGKKILIVNTASKCGNTPQYASLEKLYEKYKDKLVIVDFPQITLASRSPEQVEKFRNSAKRTMELVFLWRKKFL